MRMTLGAILIFAASGVLVVGNIVGLVFGLADGEWIFMAWAWAIGLPMMLAGFGLLVWSGRTNGRPLIPWLAIAAPCALFALGGIGYLGEGNVYAGLSALATAAGFGGWSLRLYRQGPDARFFPSDAPSDRTPAGDAEP